MKPDKVSHQLSESLSLSALPGLTMVGRNNRYDEDGCELVMLVMLICEYVHVKETEGLTTSNTINKW